MHTVIFLMVAIFFSNPQTPTAVKFIPAPSAEECLAAIPVVKEKLSSNPDVKVVKVGCLTVNDNVEGEDGSVQGR